MFKTPKSNLKEESAKKQKAQHKDECINYYFDNAH